MYLEHLSIQDFGPIDRLELDFILGANGILGDNGHGKTHVLTAIRWLIDGSLPKNQGWYLRGYGHGPKRAVVQGIFNHNGKTLDVKRTLLLTSPGDIEKGSSAPEVSAKALLRYDDLDKSIKSVTGANEKMAELTQLHHPRQLDSIFVAQGKATAPLEMRDSDRKKLFQFRSGAEVCQKALEAANRQLSGLQIQDRTEEIARIKESRTKLQDQINDVQTQVLTAQKALDALGLDEANRVIENDRQAAELTKQLTEKNEELSKCREQLKTSKENLEKTKEIAKRTEEAKTKLGSLSAYREAQRAIATYDSMRQMAAQQQKLDQQITSLKFEFAEHQEPTPPVQSREELKALEKELATHRQALTQAEDFVRIFDKTGKCPTCGQQAPKAAYDAAVSTIERVGPLDAAAGDAYSKLFAAWKAFDTAKTAYDEWFKGWEKRLSGVEELSKNTQRVQLPDEADIRGQNDLVRKYEELLDIEQTNAVEQQGLKTAVDAVKQTLSQLQDAVNELGLKAAKAPKADVVDRARAVVLQAEQHRKAIAEGDGKISGFESAIQDIEESLGKIEEEQEQNARKHEATELLEGLKRVFHNDAIPRVRTAEYMRDVNNRMIDYCEQLHAPFSLYVEPAELGFMVQFDNYATPAFQLSGGERMLAAWAFHLAEYAKHGKEFGILALDEPTVNLSDSNIANVAEVVEQLNRYCAIAGLQVIMVTHEAAVGSCFSNVLKI